MPTTQKLGIFLATAIVLLHATSRPLSGQETAAENNFPVSIPIGEQFTLRSEILNENRPLMVSVPREYHHSNLIAYPVVYLLRGPEHFHHTTGTIKHLTSAGVLPPMIVVGIVGANPIQNRTPDATEIAPRIAPKNRGAQAESSREQNFLGFLEKELFPWVETRYRTQPHRVLLGHSLAGLLVLQTLTARPDLFDGYIALSPSLDQNDQDLLGRVERDGIPPTRRPKSLFLTVGNEGGTILEKSNAFHAALATRHPSPHRWEYRVLQEEDHESIPLRGTALGLRTLFSGWKIPEPELLSKKLDGLKAHYRDLSKRLGWAIIPPESVVDRLGHRLLEKGWLEPAIATFEFNQKNYPESPDVHYNLGAAQKAQGQDLRATQNFIRAYKQAEALSPSDLRRIEEKLAQDTAFGDQGHASPNLTLPPSSTPWIEEALSFYTPFVSSAGGDPIPALEGARLLIEKMIQVRGSSFLSPSSASPAEIESLKTCARDAEPLLRNAALFALGTMKQTHPHLIGDDSHPILVEALSSNRPEVQRSAARSLGFYRDHREESIKSLIPLPGEELSVAIASGTSLTQLEYHGEELVQFLVRSLEHSRDDYRKTASFCLAQLGPHAAAAQSALLLSLEDSNRIVRFNSAAALDRIDPTLKSKSEKLKQVLAESLEATVPY